MKWGRTVSCCPRRCTSCPRGCNACLAKRIPPSSPPRSQRVLAAPSCKASPMTEYGRQTLRHATEDDVIDSHTLVATHPTHLHARALVMRKNVHRDLTRTSPDLGVLPRLHFLGTVPVKVLLPKIKPPLVPRQPHRHLRVCVLQVHGRAEDPIIHLDQRRVLVPHEILKCRSRRLEHYFNKMTPTN